MPEFAGRQVGALRNTDGGGIAVRLLDFRHLHDLRWDELAAWRGVRWSEKTPYLVVRYPAAKETIVAGRLSLDFSPPNPFKVAVHADFGAAQDDYIAECGGAGKARRKWRAGLAIVAEDE